MNSLTVKDFEHTLQKFIDEYELPYEVKRLVLSDIYNDICVKAHNELIMEATEREAKQNG